MTHLLPILLAAPEAEAAARWVDPRAIQEGLYLIPLLPMLGAAINGFLGKRFERGTVTLIACGSVATSLALAVLCFLAVFPEWNTRAETGPVLFQHFYRWFATGGGPVVDLSYAVDRLSSVLLLVITGVGLLIHIYSISYMHDDPGYARYFAYLNLFVGMMLTLVMGANLVVMFVGWEGVGLASYLLIGFWYEDDQKAYAGRKAFVANRVGDFGFLLGIFTLISLFHTVDFYRQGPGGVITAPLQASVERVAEEAGREHPAVKGELQPTPLDQLDVRGAGAFGPAAPERGQPAIPGWSYGAAITLACLLLFLGATGKSAQLPLYVWLPDAMAGPTPVSALIHAATMVTAGVYMICRLNFLFVQSPTAMLVVAAVGAATALFAAIIGTQQDDIKKVLAYSTVSQLGFMILGAGVGAYGAASLHLLTHAFFKACLFLGAGSVMHGMMNETNIWKMGGLRKDMPWTAYTFLIATIAITGFPIPISGFFSKDAILDLAKHAHLPGGEATGWVLYLVGSAAAFCTAYYMFRAYILTFEGERRSLRDHHAHESMLMNVPLAILATLSVVALIWGVPFVTEGESHITLWDEYLKPLFEVSHKAMAARTVESPELVPYGAWLVAWIIGAGGAGLAYSLFMAKPIAATDLAAERPVGNSLVEVIKHKFYVDEIYDALFIQPIKRLADFLFAVVDQLLIDTFFVRGWGFVTGVFADLFRTLQNGSTQRYAAVMAVSLAALLFASPIQKLVHNILAWFGL